MSEAKKMVGEQKAEAFISGQPVFDKWARLQIGMLMSADLKDLKEVADELGGNKAKTKWQAIQKILHVLSQPESCGPATRRWLFDELRHRAMWWIGDTFS